MSNDLMIKIERVSKKYNYGQIGGTTLAAELQRIKAKLRHQEDPTKKIGAVDYNRGDSFMALDNVSFEVKKGERVGIIGKNGAGKSTLLKLLSRVTGPTSGEIGLNGRVASMLEVGTGFHPELTGRENIYLNGAILGMTKKEIDAKIDAIIDFSEVREFIDTPVKRYSSGMYVKLAFSVAAHLDSEILIMDEVLAVGDVAFQQKCIRKMNAISQDEGRTILYVSHNMSTIRQLCKRCVVLERGKLIFDGDVESAISVYSGTNEVLLKKEYDITQRIQGDYGRYLRITSASFFNRENYHFEESELLIIKLNWSIIAPFNDLSLRIDISSPEFGPVASSVLFNKFSSDGKISDSCVFSLDISSLQSGYYNTVFSFFYSNKNKYAVDVETVDGLSFIKHNNSFPVKWKKNWGAVSLNGLNLVEERNNDKN